MFFLFFYFEKETLNPSVTGKGLRPSGEGGCKTREVYGLFFQQPTHKESKDVQVTLVPFQIGSKLRDE